jgi:hypothetical protein
MPFKPWFSDDFLVTVCYREQSPEEQVLRNDLPETVLSEQPSGNSLLGTIFWEQSAPSNGVLVVYSWK